MAHMFHGTGWLPDPFNEQDFQYTPRSDIVIKPSRNLRTDSDTKNFWESRTQEQKDNAQKGSGGDQGLQLLVLNQYSLGSCVANAVTAVYSYELRRANASQKTDAWFLPSRNFIYYNARQAMNNPVMKDDGCHNRNAMKSLHKLGVVSEEALPYPFDPQEIDKYGTYNKTQFQESCKTHVQKLSGDDVLGSFEFASENEAENKKQALDQTKIKKAEELKANNELEKLRAFYLEYINSLEPGGPHCLLNDAWWDILHRVAAAKSALYPGIHRYLTAKYFRIAKYERLDARRTYNQQLAWTKQETRNEAAMNEDGNLLKDNVMKALSDGHPVVFGFRFYLRGAAQFEQIGTNKLWSVKPLSGRHQWPPQDEKLGGHAVVAVGYDDKNVIVLNSWGKSWGNAGLFLMPWGWITDFVATRDFWILESFRDASNVDDEDIKDMKKDLFEFSKAFVKKQMELKSTQEALVAAKLKLAKHDSTTNTSTKYDAPVIQQPLTTNAIEKMKVDEIQTALYNAQKNLFEVEKQLRPLTEELAVVNQKLAKF